MMRGELAYSYLDLDHMSTLNVDRLTYTGLDVDLPLGEEVLQVLHPQLHQVAPHWRTFVQHSAPF